MKRFAKIGKLFLYIILGGLIAFVMGVICLTIKGYGIASDISRDILVIASEEGCVNNATLVTMMEGFKNSYEVQTQKTNADGSARRDNYFIFDYTNGYGDYIEVTSPDTGNIINADGCDYTSFVQRGSTVEVTATVYVRLYLPFKLMNDGSNMDGISNSTWQDILNGNITIPVSSKAIGISTKFYKGA